MATAEDWEPLRPLFDQQHLPLWPPRHAVMPIPGINIMPNEGGRPIGFGGDAQRWLLTAHQPGQADQAHPQAQAVQGQDADAMQLVDQQGIVPGAGNGYAEPQDGAAELEATLIMSGTHPTLYLLPHPTPNPAYLMAAQGEPWEIKFKRSLLVVLDLNGTLLVRKNGSANFTPRPFVDQFLQYLCQNHFVVIWSSATPTNVMRMINKLFPTPDSRKCLIKMWSRNNLRLGEHYNKKVQVYKQLSWLWEDETLQDSFPGIGGYKWDQTNTVLIDDSLEKGAAEPFNLLKIDEFTMTEDGMRVDVLGQVAAYLERLRRFDNVSACIRQQPFRTLLDAGGRVFDWASVGVAAP